jgi:hypothetical protein
MAQVTGSILFVKVDAVPIFPQVVKDFIEKYFKETEILGVKHYYAFRELNGVKDCNGFNCSPKKGVAPSHFCHLSEKVDDVTTLYAWLEKMLEDKNQTNIFALTEYWDDGRFVDYD